jgi:Mrp family chromosome partitioning ATPase
VRLRIPAKTFDNSKDQRSIFFSWILRVSSLFEKLCEEVGGKALIIALHSYKGGTGKTLLSVNLATIFARMGKKVGLLDLDLRAPSIHSFFKNGSNYWVND